MLAMATVQEKILMTFPMELLRQFAWNSIFSIYIKVIQNLAKKVMIRNSKWPICPYMVTRNIFKKIIVEGYRDVGSLNDSFQSSNFLLVPFVVVVLHWFWSVVRPISQRSTSRFKSERTMVCGRLCTGSQTDIKLYGRTNSWTNLQMDRRADLSRSDTNRWIQLLSLSENGKAKEST